MKTLFICKEPVLFVSYLLPRYPDVIFIHLWSYHVSLIPQLRSFHLASFVGRLRPVDHYRWTFVQDLMQSRDIKSRLTRNIESLGPPFYKFVTNLKTINTKKVALNSDTLAETKMETIGGTISKPA